MFISERGDRLSNASYIYLSKELLFYKQFVRLAIREIQLRKDTWKVLTKVIISYAYHKGL